MQSMSLLRSQMDKSYFSYNYTYETVSVERHTYGRLIRWGGKKQNEFLRDMSLFLQVSDILDFINS